MVTKCKHVNLENVEIPKQGNVLHSLEKCLTLIYLTSFQQYILLNLHSLYPVYKLCLFPCYITILIC